MHRLQINQVGLYALDIDRVDENSDRGTRQGMVGVQA